MTTINEQIAAGHRSIIRRSMRRHAGGTDADRAIQYLDGPALDAWAKENPAKLAPVLGQWFERAADAWVDGNNSGNARTLELREADCDRIRAQAESVLSLFGIKVDYPGLYPCFEHNGRHYHTTEELARCLGEVNQ